MWSQMVKSPQCPQRVHHVYERMLQVMQSKCSFIPTICHDEPVRKQQGEQNIHAAVVACVHTPCSRYAPMKLCCIPTLMYIAEFLLRAQLLGTPQKKQSAWTLSGL